ncbi:CheA signal transduction histidine kinase [Pirellula staleyi DSM 6068]|uniref:Chemotaxis protein CheA n=1 Tax=Pirellula staleyi (strain ATCC 27377 / DSM 6068 / ICPB 4128) TaxID=530564 RepID=D2QXD7_PIRSD|nr:chemotaxis protein CheA [Pirellula staleyi]ADB17977.1 CheA signal transduction histidine kinase [Pirellula staleyi DSM 6068]
MAAMDQQLSDELGDSLLTDFLDEANQLLVKLNEDLLTLDEWVASRQAGQPSSFDSELMTSMFRSAHSLKGLSAMLGLPHINQLTHRVENVFDAARKSELQLDSSNVQVIFSAIDSLEAMIDMLKNTGNDEVDASEVMTRIENVLVEAGCHREAKSQQDAEAALAAITAEVTLLQAPSEPSTLQEDEGIFAGIEDEQEVPSRYLAIFIDEADLSLDSLTETLVSDEQLAGDSATESLLITAHRIKGSAASLGLHRAAKLSHLMEDLLQDLHNSGCRLKPSMVDALLKSTDALRGYVASLKAGVPKYPQFAAAARDLCSSRELCASIADTKMPTSSAQESPASTAAPAIASLDHLTEASFVASLRQQFPTAENILVGQVRFDASQPLVGLKASLVYEKLCRAGQSLYNNPPGCDLENLDDLEYFDFAISTTVPLETLRTQLLISGVSEVLLDLIADQPPVAAAPMVTLSSLAPVARTASAEPKAAAAKLVDDDLPVSNDHPEAAVSDASAKSKAAERDTSNRPNETLRVDIERLDQLMNLAGQLVINKARFTQIGEGIRETLPAKGTLQMLGNASMLIDRLCGDGESNSHLDEWDLDQAKSHVRRVRADLQIIQRELSRLSKLRNRVNELFEAVHQLDRVADGIQKSVMDTRMVPIGPLFSRFKRVVRDVTRINGKDIRLDIRGEKTELDKRMIDELGDPLIHMVRNSADHGVETSADRVAAGKSAQGCITLDAFHRGNSIVIQVIDDGKGLDSQRILKKAIERGLVSEADAERMTSHQIYQLIWEPGFSTAEKVTEISGRGMGMDIVRSKIEGLSGTVEVDSTPGQGATFTIKLPLTLAILPSLMAAVDGDVFSLPIESIVEIVSVPRRQLSTVHGMLTASIRGRIVSVVNLKDIFTWRQNSSRSTALETTDSTLVVLGHDGCEIGLVVDSVLGEDDVVIKSLAENYRNVRGIAGASILGDGRVSLILDIPTLIEMASGLAELPAAVV